MPRKQRPRVLKSDREPALVAELRDAIRDCDATNYRIAQKAGIDENAVRRFVTRERSLTLESAARLAEALGMRIVRPSRGRRPAWEARKAGGGDAPGAAGPGAGPVDAGGWPGG